MADVTFHEEAASLPGRPSAGRPRGLAGALVGAGLARTEAGANAILLALAALILAAAGYFCIVGQPTQNAPTPERQAEFEALKRDGLTR
jgi:hypothetical protein